MKNYFKEKYPTFEVYFQNAILLLENKDIPMIYFKECYELQKEINEISLWYISQLPM